MDSGGGGVFVPGRWRELRGGCGDGVGESPKDD